jgi:hypothetical protein
VLCISNMPSSYVDLIPFPSNSIPNKDTSSSRMRNLMRKEQGVAVSVTKAIALSSDSDELDIPEVLQIIFVYSFISITSS